ncbi:hypothetical protein COLO4_24950 [Corchorus olitorius]|uniref:Endonuclease/exonuclease/phosphatase n=1 Tax=Corchorus olitorius TaxID=93759 RepID=A0A1R3I5T8_9ROSI|nr:hypothetical protein COLO4_24950 [Corchorus olitorius]
MAAQPIQFPTKSNLSATMHDFVELIEIQFQISYPSMPLAASPQFQQNPTLIDIIKIVLTVAHSYPPCGPSGVTLLGHWLGVMQAIDINSINLEALLEDQSILKELYTRGLTHCSVPELCLHQSFREIEHRTLTNGVTRIHILGELKKIFIVNTTPVSNASLYTLFSVSRPDQTTLHECRLRLHTSNEPGASPMRILIINASGIRNPAFMVALTEHRTEFNPHLVLVTETRLGGVEGRLARLSTNFRAATYLETVGNFGGVWLLWNSRILRLQIIVRTDRSLTTKLDPIM